MTVPQFRVVLTLTLGFMIVFVAGQNADNIVQIKFLGWEMERVPVFLFIIGSALAGTILVPLIAMFYRKK